MSSIPLSVPAALTNYWPQSIATVYVTMGSSHENNLSSFSPLNFPPSHYLFFFCSIHSLCHYPLSMIISNDIHDSFNSHFIPLLTLFLSSLSRSVSIILFSMWVSDMAMLMLLPFRLFWHGSELHDKKGGFSSLVFVNQICPGALIEMPIDIDLPIDERLTRSYLFPTPFLINY